MDWHVWCAQGETGGRVGEYFVADLTSRPKDMRGAEVQDMVDPTDPHLNMQHAGPLHEYITRPNAEHEVSGRPCLFYVPCAALWNTR